jgi:hypothetical protein
LEEESQGLGAAFYWSLTLALYRVMRLYNHDDALMYEERLVECAEEDEENRNQYEFPEVAKALPECIQKTLKPEHQEWTLNQRRLLRRHRKGQYRNWIGRLRRIQQLSRLHLKRAHDHLEDHTTIALLYPRFSSLSVIAMQSQHVSMRSRSTCWREVANPRSISPFHPMTRRK